MGNTAVTLGNVGPRPEQQVTCSVSPCWAELSGVHPSGWAPSNRTLGREQGHGGRGGWEGRELDLLGRHRAAPGCSPSLAKSWEPGGTGGGCA